MELCSSRTWAFWEDRSLGVRRVARTGLHLTGMVHSVLWFIVSRDEVYQRRAEALPIVKWISLLRRPVIHPSFFSYFRERSKNRVIRALPCLASLTLPSLLFSSLLDYALQSFTSPFILLILYSCHSRPFQQTFGNCLLLICTCTTFISAVGREGSRRATMVKGLNPSLNGISRETADRFVQQ